MGLFYRSTEIELIEILAGQLSAYTPPQVSPAHTDRWIAISSLHKCIRRGEVELALQATTCLLRIDPNYLFRRLPIVAYEDIGTANPLLCSLTTVSNSGYLHRLFGKERVALYLVQELAKSTKSRTATDLYCLTECDPYASQYLESCLSQSPSTWAGTAQDDSLPWAHRMTALRLITGYKWRGLDGRFQQVSSSNADLILDACDAFNLPDSIRWAALCGHGKTEGLNGALLLAHQIYSQSPAQRISATELETTDIDGIALPALDQFSRVGKAAINSFISNSHPIKSFLRRHNVSNPLALVGIAVFQIEGSLLDNALEFDESVLIREEVEDLYLQQAGLHGKDLMDELRHLVRNGMGELNKTRTEKLCPALLFDSQQT